MKKDYPGWACAPCGQEHGSKKKTKPVSGWHFGRCEVCGKNAPVTPPRDFGHFERWFR